MALSRLFFIATVCLATTLTHAAGIDLIEVPADKDGPALRGAVWKSRCDISRTQFAKATCVLSSASRAIVAARCSTCCASKLFDTTHLVYPSVFASARQFNSLREVNAG